MNFDIKEELKNLPETSGVYLMHNKMDEIIYVGKAINLKNRVRQYFHHNKNRSNKIEQMIASIEWFEYIQVSSELEALVLESNLIKKYRPRYNSVLRDDENHPYFKISIKESCPRITIDTGNTRDLNSIYLGPYYRSMEPEEMLEFVNGFFRLRSCRRSSEQIEKGGTCLNYHIGKCSGPCIGKISKEEYHKNVVAAIRFIQGSGRKEVREKLQKSLETAVNNLEFEKASGIQEQLNRLQKINTKFDFTDRDHKARGGYKVREEYKARGGYKVRGDYRAPENQRVRGDYRAPENQRVRGDYRTLEDQRAREHRRAYKDYADLFAIAKKGTDIAIIIMLIRNRKMIGRDLFYIKESDIQRYSEKVDAEKYAEKSHAQKYPQKAESEKYAEKSHAQKYPQKAESEKYAEKSHAQKYTQKADAEKYAEELHIQKYSEKVDAEKYIEKTEKQKMAEYLKEFVQEFYQRSPYIPPHILLTERIPEQQKLSELLSEKRESKVTITAPRTGEYGRLVSYARESAVLLLQQK